MAKGQQLVSTLLESEPGEWMFTTRITSDLIEISDHEEGTGYRDASGDLTVVWEASFDADSGGIKAISPVVHKVTGQLLLTDPETDEVAERIPISWPRPATDQHLQVVLGKVPAAGASPKDFASYYGPAHDEWSVETEVFQRGSMQSLSLVVRKVAISVQSRAITVQF